MSIAQSPLGKKTSTISEYQPDLLCPISRVINRQQIGIHSHLPFKGVDVWNAYELSWLNNKGRPQVAMGEFIFPCESPYLIESKSFKLYLNSFNHTSFHTIQDVIKTIEQDLSNAAGAKVAVSVIPLQDMLWPLTNAFKGFCLDEHDIVCDTYHIDPSYLRTLPHETTEIVYSHLLKSNCLVTGQPDWGSIHIEYSGKKIEPEGLLKYIVSYRNHNEFHEHCVERIFVDIMQNCAPNNLSVQACYTRRGGLDINPYRSTAHSKPKEKIRDCRQ